MTNTINWDQKQIDRLGLKIVIQAVRDFAFPEQIERIRSRMSKLDKGDPDYMDIVAKMFKAERKKIIKDLKGSFVRSMSNGKSDEIVRKLEKIMNDKTGQSLLSLKTHLRTTYIEEDGEE